MRALSAGSEIDAWCTKCRMDLGHRIVAMVGDRPKRVICMTCGSQHNFRPPRAQPTAQGLKRGHATSTAKASTTKASTAKTRSRSRVQRQQLGNWEAQVGGHDEAEFTRYATDKRFEPGQLVEHRKFGKGYVSEHVDSGKVSVVFRDGPRVLVHDQS